jgi:hypothetical protein
VENFFIADKTMPELRFELVTRLFGQDYNRNSEQFEAGETVGM